MHIIFLASAIQSEVNYYWIKIEKIIVLFENSFLSFDLIYVEWVFPCSS